MSTTMKAVAVSIFLHMCLFLVQFAYIGDTVKHNLENINKMNGLAGDSQDGDCTPDQIRAGTCKANKGDDISSRDVKPPVKVRVLEEKDLPSETKKGSGDTAKSTQENDNCDSYYGGIGLVTVDGIVTEVFPEYPASLSGIMVDDLILSPPAGEVQGKVGTTVTLEISRGNIIITFEIVRGKICLNAPRD